jgi:ribonuclease R
LTRPPRKLPAKPTPPERPKKPSQPEHHHPRLPSRQEILDFIAASPTPVGKREIARAFKVGAADRVALKGLLKDIQRAGVAERTTGRRLKAPDALPEVAVIEIAALDEDGVPQARPIGFEAGDAAPSIRLVERKGEAAMGLGERAVARLRKRDDGGYDAAVIRRISTQSERVLGVFHAERDGGGKVTPTDHARRREGFRVRPTETLGAQDGELVVGEPLPLPRLGLPHVQVTERLGRLDDPRAISLVAIHAQGIPVGFPPEALNEAERARPVGLGQRTDLRSVPLITIDGADARDFDDAVFAEPDDAVEGGWHLLVAIADVAWYVRPGSALDRSAKERGNSVYFPDRVVPMLPEALSNELCSLKPGVDRACMAIHLWIDAEGRLTRHQAVRGLMRSTARLTYEQVQAAIDGRPDDLTRELVEPVLQPLYGAFRLLDRARRQRGSLDLDLPERRVKLAPDGTVAAIERRERLDSHKLIEEFMIAANVAAAEILEKLHQPCMYRVHDAPDPAKLEALSEFLTGLEIPGLKLARGQVIRPAAFNRILAAAVGRPEAPLVNELVLRSQAQAIYAPDNIGHFGLALRRYAHFTSPIRRYSDLLVHRALIAGARLGEDGLPPTNPEDFAELGLHLSRTERRAATAERQAIDRYMVAYLGSRIGGHFTGRVNGVTRFGLFVTLDESGADGLVPISTLPADFYHHDADHHRLVGQRSGRTYTLGDTVEIRLTEADPIGGKLVFGLMAEGDGGAVSSRPPPRRGGPPKGGKPRKIPGTAPRPRKGKPQRRAP